MHQQSSHTEIVELLEKAGAKGEDDRNMGTDYPFT